MYLSILQKKKNPKSPLDSHPHPRRVGPVVLLLSDFSLHSALLLLSRMTLTSMDGPVAVASARLPNKAFAGDGPIELDLLIEACNGQRPIQAHLACLIGRDLTPFVFEDAYDPKKAASACSKKAIPQGKPVAGHSGSTSPAAPQRPAAPTSPKSDNGRTTTPATKKASRASFEGEASPLAKATPAAAFRSLGCRADVEALLTPTPPRPGSKACPAFFSSPRPEVIPMPCGLLARVAPVKA